MVVAQARHRKKPVKKAVKRSGGRGASLDAPNVWQRHQRDLSIVALLVVGLFVALAEVGALGPVGRAISRGLSDVLGVARFAMAIILLALGVAMVWGKIEFDRARVGWGVVLGLVSISGIADVASGRPGVHSTTKVLGRAGGWLGVSIGGGLAKGLGVAGALVVFFAVLVIATMVTTGIGLRALLVGGGVFFRALGRVLSRWWMIRPQRDARDEDDDEDASMEPLFDDELEPEPEAFAYDDFIDDEVEPEFGDVDDEPEDEPAKKARVKRPRHVKVPSAWVLPPLSLLQRTRDQKLDRSMTDAAGEELVDALAAHGVETTLLGYTVGPTVTRFELELGPGVKVSRVTSLNKDIAYAMASADVRILAPIPGRSAIGVEVPNRHRQLVALGDILASPEAAKAHHPLEVALGRDIAGNAYMVNLADMPHLLVSGSTGSGKSSSINSILPPILIRATPDQVRLMLVDPKRVELGQYNDLPHLLTQVVVDPKKAANALSWAVKEMERRYDLLAEAGMRDITGYNIAVDSGQLEDHEEAYRLRMRGTGSDDEASEQSPEEDERRYQRLPFILIVVDELNDLMMVAARDVEDSVCRIAQMARAVGIHLVLATQRPSVDVITGVIKANIPSRMAFSVSSLADSRVILDQPGAERLIGKGDMLLVTASSSNPQRLQAPWVGADEVRAVAAHWKRQRPMEVVAGIDEVARTGRAGQRGADDDDEELLAQAMDLVVRSQLGSTSMLQRKLRVGFARAGRLMDLMERGGVVGPSEGSKARTVLMTVEELEER